MKNLISYTLVFVFACVLSAFKPGNDNANIITFGEGQIYFWRADNCTAPLIPALTERRMTSSKGFFMVDVTFQLPEGHCDIPSRGTIFRRYEGLDQWAVIHSDGSVRGKILVQPNH
jgi:hypothetical protein